MSSEFSHVPEAFRQDCAYRVLQELETHYRDYREYLATAGKDPDRKIGFAEDTVTEKYNRTLRFHKFVWEQTDSGILRVTHTDADRFEQGLIDDTVRTIERKSYAETSKRKLQQAVKNYFEFLAARGGGEPWNPSCDFSQTVHEQADYFTLEERSQLYEATLTHNDLGKYNDLSPQERDRRKQYLAQRLGKPKSNITPDDFDKCSTSWKVPSLISVSLDLGARPKFISRCAVHWYLRDKGVLSVPKEGSVKNDASWEPSLSSRSIQSLDRWVEQRATDPTYDGVEALWLNREGNPYRSGPLNYLLNQLMQEAGIDQSNRRLVWTSIRRSTASYLTYFRSLAYAKQQLRHKSLQSTLRYVEIPVEARQEVLNQIDGAPITPTSQIEQSPGDYPDGQGGPDDEFNVINGGDLQ